MAAAGSDDPGAVEVDAVEVEIGSAPNAALAEVIVSTLKGEGIRARLAGTRIMVPGRFQTKARDILDFLVAEIAKNSG